MTAFTCHICAALVDPSAAQVAKHMQWHEALTTLTLRLSGGELTDEESYAAARVIVDNLPPFEEVMAAAATTIEHLKTHPLAPEPSDFAATTDAIAALVDDDEPPEPEPPAASRPAQVPEDAWAELNAEQRTDVAGRVDRILARQQTIDEARHPADVATAQRYLTESLESLTEDYGFALLPAEHIAQADAGLSGPAPSRVSKHSDHTLRELRDRKLYLLAKQGLPHELEEDRREELAEIERRLRTRA